MGSFKFYVKKQPSLLLNGKVSWRAGDNPFYRKSSVHPCCENVACKRSRKLARLNDYPIAQILCKVEL